MNMNVGVVVVVRGWVLCALNEGAEASWRKGWHHWMLSLWPCLRLRIPTNGILTHIPGAFPDKEGEGSDSNGVFIDYDFSFGLLLWLDSAVWLFAGLWVIAKNLSDSEGRIHIWFGSFWWWYICARSRPYPKLNFVGCMYYVIPQRNTPIRALPAITWSLEYCKMDEAMLYFQV